MLLVPSWWQLESGVRQALTKHVSDHLPEEGGQAPADQARACVQGMIQIRSVAGDADHSFDLGMENSEGKIKRLAPAYASPSSS